MDPIAEALLTLGAVLLVGLLADLVAEWIRLPRVTLLLALGFALGPRSLGLLPPITDDWFPIASTVALSMVGFLLGAGGRLDRLRGHGSAVLVIAILQALTTALVVIVGLIALGADTVVAISLGGIAVATDPAATLAVVQEGRADGPLTRALLAVVALDDVIALTLFGLLVTGAGFIAGEGAQVDLLVDALWEILGAAGLGIVVGVPAATLTGRIRAGRPTQEEAYGLVLVTAGLALWLGVSFLLAAVALGATVANRAAHHETPFDEIERIEWPALVVFFVLAGASLDLGTVRDVGVIGLGYVAFRAMGKVLGCIAGVHLTGKPEDNGRWLGPAMLPQAGVAIGLTLLAADRFPDLADDLIPVVIATTMVFELIGPIATSIALRRSGELGSAVSS